MDPVLFAYREVPQLSTGFSPFQLLYGPGTILKELCTKEVNIPKVNFSYEYVTELREQTFLAQKLSSVGLSLCIVIVNIHGRHVTCRPTVSCRYIIT